MDLYYYKGKVYTELQLESNYDITNSYFKKYRSNWLKISKLDSNLIRLEYKLISLNEPKDIIKDSLSEINLNFILQKGYTLENIPDAHKIKEFKLKEFWNNKI